MSEVERRKRIARWVAMQVMPHEPAVRAWLRRSRATPEDADEIVQEAYCRLATLDSIDHIGRADAYFFSIVRNLYVRRLKRSRIVPIDAIATIESCPADEAPSPERQVAARLEVERVLMLIDRLPERCRRIVQMRRIEGLSQKEIAMRLGVTEKVVEKQVWTGIRLVRSWWQTASAEADSAIAAPGDARKST